MKKLLFVLFSVIAFISLNKIAMAYTILDNSTGGDCYQIGTWDSATKTCTLNRDIQFYAPGGTGIGITIGSSGITIDGNSHKVTNTNTYPSGTGIYSIFKNNLIIKNIIIERTNMCMSFVGHPRVIFSGLLIENNTCNTIRGTGLNTGRIQNIIIRGNSLNGELGRGNYGIIMSEHGISVNDNYISNFETGIFNFGPDNSFIANNIFDNLTLGIELGNSSNTVIEGNRFINSYCAIQIRRSDHTEVRNNNFETFYGIWYAEGYEGNKIYRNNFITDSRAFDDISQTTAALNLDLPIGGNYWSAYDEPSEGCVDYNGDRICDSPYSFTYSTDYLPWTKPSAWEVVTIPDIINIINGHNGNGNIYNKGIYNSLIQKLQNAQRAEERGNIDAAKNILNALLNEVEALSGKKISAEAATDIMAAVKEALEDM